MAAQLGAAFSSADASALALGDPACVDFGTMAPPGVPPSVVTESARACSYTMFIYELVSLTTLGWAGAASSSAWSLGDAVTRRVRVASSRPLNFG